MQRPAVRPPETVVTLASTDSSVKHLLGDRRVDVELFSDQTRYFLFVERNCSGVEVLPLALEVSKVPNGFGFLRWILVAAGVYLERRYLFIDVPRILGCIIR